MATKVHLPLDLVRLTMGYVLPPNHVESPWPLDTNRKRLRFCHRCACLFDTENMILCWTAALPGASCHAKLRRLETCFPAVAYDSFFNMVFCCRLCYLADGNYKIRQQVNYPDQPLDGHASYTFTCEQYIDWVKEAQIYEDDDSE